MDWWHPVTKEKYVKKAECIIKQYGNYSLPELGLSLNGINTQGENIADNGGIKEAYRAYSKSDKCFEIHSGQKNPKILIFKSRVLQFSKNSRIYFFTPKLTKNLKMRTN